jgi:hypothetical protein
LLFLIIKLQIENVDIFTEEDFPTFFNFSPFITGLFLLMPDSQKKMYHQQQAVITKATNQPVRYNVCLPARPHGRIIFAHTHHFYQPFNWLTHSLLVSQFP